MYFVSRHLFWYLHTVKVEMAGEKMLKKRIMIMFLLLFCFQLSGQITSFSPVVITAEAGDLDDGSGNHLDFWSSMNVTDDGTFDPGVANDSDATIEGDGILSKYKGVIALFCGILTITAFAFMIFCFTKLSVAGSNDMARRNAIRGILTSGIGIALMGSATILIGAFWNAL